MLKKTITYTDFNGNQRTEDFYFNLSKAELAEWELRENLQGGLSGLVERVSGSNDGRLIMDTFRDLIKKTYGVKSEDGRSFRKSDELSEGFLGSEAYSELFMGMISNPGEAAAFVNGIMPADLQVEAGLLQQRNVPQDRLQKKTVERELPTAVEGVQQQNTGAVDEVLSRQPFESQQLNEEQLAEYHAWVASKKNTDDQQLYEKQLAEHNALVKSRENRDDQPHH